MVPRAPSSQNCHTRTPKSAPKATPTNGKAANMRAVATGAAKAA